MCHTDDGRIPVEEWLATLDVKDRARVRIHIDRMEDGNFGDVEPVGEGVSESKLDFGPGYRVYFGQKGNEVHLINGGFKKGQQKDINAARSSGGLMGKTSSYRESLLSALTDPEEAVAYLNAGLEDSLPAFLKALKNVTQAHQMTKIAKDSGVQRETLYRSLSEQGNPTLQTLASVLTAIGLRIKVEPSASDALAVLVEARVTSAKANRKEPPDRRRKPVLNAKSGERSKASVAK